MAERQPWEWRLAAGGVISLKGDLRLPDGKLVRVFHAYDVNANAACEPSIGLGVSCEEPTEGSALCVTCIEQVKDNPAGRDRRVYSQ